MQTNTLFGAGLVAAVTLAIQPLPAPDVEFAPDAGASVTKTFTEEMEIELTSAVMRMGDQEQIPDELEVSMASTRNIALVDTYTKSADGRPTELKRKFETIEQEFSVSVSQRGGGEETSVTSSSALEGSTVQFEWDADDEEYSVKYAEEEDGDEDLLEGLVEDTDLRGFLPGDEVDKGDEWEVPIEALASLVVPGGELSVLPDDIDGDDEESIVFGYFTRPSGIHGEVEGEVTATLKEIEGGIATIDLVVKYDSSNDIYDAMVAVISAAGIDEEEFDDMESLELTCSFDGVGALEWNMEAGRAESVELEGEIELALTAARSMEMGDRSIDMVMEIELEGTTRFTLGVEGR